jgi:hypothetical protein
MATIPNHLDVVKAARARYEALAGPERAHRIVNAVAWELRDEGAGLFLKTGGTRFADRSLDVIIFKGGETFDVLRDAEGKAEPAWSRTKPTGMGNPEKWRAAVDPGPVSGGTSGEPSNGPSDQPLDVAAEIKAIRAALDALIARLEP